MFSKTVLVISIFFGVVCTAQARPIDHQYSKWDALTRKHVQWLPDNSQSRVDYTGFKADHQQLNQVLDEFSSVTQSEFDQWTQAQQMAFMINAYNGFTIELILTKYPNLKSIKDLGSLIQSPWKKKFFKLLGAEHNLDWIENDVLRIRYNDPRIHVGINCASIGCPALRAEAYTGSKIDTQLDDGVLRFATDKTRNRYHDGKLEVSEIFKWFANDFEKGNKGFSQVNDVFARFSSQIGPDKASQTAIRNKTVSISYLPYDWTLNDIKH
jgi:hypothetical protein